MIKLTDKQIGQRVTTKSGNVGTLGANVNYYCEDLYPYVVYFDDGIVDLYTDEGLDNTEGKDSQWELVAITRWVLREGE